MNCFRCKKKFKQRELNQLAKLFRYMLAPIILIHPTWRYAMDEGKARYCNSCARILNMCLFFAVLILFVIPVLAIVFKY